MSPPSRDTNVAKPVAQVMLSLRAGGEAPDLSKSTLTNSNDNDVSITLPMDIFSKVASFCPLPTLLTMRATNKQFRSFVSKECLERRAKDLAKRRAQSKNKQNSVRPSSSNRTWADSKQRTIEKALELAKSVFFETDEDGTSRLLADGYDDMKVKAALQKDKFVLEPREENGSGTTNFWRIEARWEAVTVSQAIREIRLYHDDWIPLWRMDTRAELFLLMSAPSGVSVAIAEVEVALWHNNGGLRQWKALQQFTIDTRDGFGWFIPFPTRSITSTT